MDKKEGSDKKKKEMPNKNNLSKSGNQKGKPPKPNIPQKETLSEEKPKEEKLHALNNSEFSKVFSIKKQRKTSFEKIKSEAKIPQESPREYTDNKEKVLMEKERRKQEEIENQKELLKKIMYENVGIRQNAKKKNLEIFRPSVGMTKIFYPDREIENEEEKKIIENYSMDEEIQEDSLEEIKEEQDENETDTNFTQRNQKDIEEINNKVDETNKLIMEKTERINYLEQMLNEQVPELVKESVEEHIEENIGESNDKILGMNSGIKEQIHSKITEKIKLLKQYN